MKREVFSGVQLCGDLEPKQKCFKLQRYHEGQFDLVFHEHVPSHRISLENAIEAMRALVLRHEGFAASRMLRCYLNDRGKTPQAVGLLRIVVEYPEPGVIRRNCGGSQFNAWMDEVINSTTFRKSAGL